MKKRILSSLIILATTTLSHAALVVFPGQDIPIPNNFEGVYLDIETGSTAASPFAGADINFFFGGEGIGNDADDAAATPTLQFLRTGTGFLDAAVNSSVADPIDFGATSFATGFGGSGSPNDHLGTGAGNFVDGAVGYLAFSLNISGATHYGFLEVTLTDNTAGVIHGWAYNDVADEQIIVAPVASIPEPSASLLSLLTLGLFALRRRR